MPKLKYFYLGHNGGTFTLDKALDNADLLCGGCGTYDIFIGTYRTDEEHKVLECRAENLERRGILNG